MRVYLGNASPADAPGPTFTVSDIKDYKDENGEYIVGYVVGSDAADVKEHLFDNPGLVTHLPGNAAILNVIRSWPDQGREKPTWVKVEADERDPEIADDFERFLSEYWKCPRGIPHNVEETHYTENGPPGFGPA